MRSISAALIFGLMLQGAPAYSAVSAHGLYAEGEYAEAISAGEAEGGASGFALAARAALADAELRDVPCLECLRRAEELARMAIAANPEHTEAYAFLVTALGRRARLIGFFASQREGIAGQTDNAIGTALQLEPSSSVALALRGAWHIEVVSQAGRFLGRVLYGARVEEGKRFFREATQLEPENLVINYQYALSLHGLDFAGEQPEIETALEAASSGAPRDAYEGSIRARAEILLNLLQDGMEDAFHEHIMRYRGEA
ncbi:MAG: hypothetical protein V3S07_06845 [Micropepsaceae bacterium]